MELDADTTERESRSIKAINFGLGANFFLAVFKTFMGMYGHSPALLSDGINSTSDVGYTVVVRVFAGKARKPADEDHPYGYRQFETIAALVVGSFVITTALAILLNSVNRTYDLFTGRIEFAGASFGALIVGVCTIAIKCGLFFFTRQVGREAANAAVMALAYDHRNDIFAASAASVGIFLGRMGYPWVDPLAGGVVAIVILATGIKILRQSSADLMDTVPGKELREQIEHVLSRIPGVQEVQEVQAHRFGPYFVVNLTIGINGSLTIVEGDRITEQVEQSLQNKIAYVKRVHVHCNPVEQKNAA